MNAPNLPSLLGVKFLAGREAGECWIYQFAFEVGNEAQGCVELIRQLGVGHAICVPGACKEESYREVRRTCERLELRTSHHGITGTWQPATCEEVLAFLAPSAARLDGSDFCFTGTYTIDPENLI